MTAQWPKPRVWILDYSKPVGERARPLDEPSLTPIAAWDGPVPAWAEGRWATAKGDAK